MIRRLTAFGPAAISLVLGGAVLFGLGRTRIVRDEVAHTHEVITTLDHVMLRMVDAETGVRGYRLTRDSSYLEPFAGASRDITNDEARLRELVSDNPGQQSR